EMRSKMEAMEKKKIAKCIVKALMKLQKSTMQTDESEESSVNGDSPKKKIQRRISTIFSSFTRTIHKTAVPRPDFSPDDEDTEMVQDETSKKSRLVNLLLDVSRGKYDEEMAVQKLIGMIESMDVNTICECIEEVQQKVSSRRTRTSHSKTAVPRDVSPTRERSTDGDEMMEMGEIVEMEGDPASPRSEAREEHSTSSATETPAEATRSTNGVSGQ
ncbi:hypothetical protein PMAYCL1PPCAC_20710, partial [Pristionchus mayeri]